MYAAKKRKNLFTRIFAGLGMRSFTLTEIIVATAILAFLTIAIYGIGATGKRSWEVGESMLRSQQRARNALIRMENELRLTDRVTLTDSAIASTATFSIPIDADQDGNIDLSPRTNTVVYGAEDYNDYNGNGEFWEEDWSIQYQIDRVNRQFIRRILDDRNRERSRIIIATNISLESGLSFFRSESGLSTGTATQLLDIQLTVDIDTVQGKAITPPLRTTLIGSATLRN